MLLFSDQSSFSTGRMTCDIRPISGSYDDSNRLFIQIAIEGVLTRAVIDTGGVYLVVEPNVAQELTLDSQIRIGNTTLSIRGNKITGSLYRINMRLPAEEGEDLVQEVTAFIPDATVENWGELPTYMGLMSCLEFLKFAVDPAENHFYFASL
jgi:hypothetical protein